MTLIYLRSILGDVKKIKNKKTKLKLKETIQNLKEAEALEDMSSVKKLSGHPSAYRIRIGDYRLGFYLEENTIILVRFVKRNDIYKLFP